MPEEEIRWHYRFQNFSRAFGRLQDALKEGAESPERTGAGGRDQQLIGDPGDLFITFDLHHSAGHYRKATKRSDIDLATRGILNRHRLGRLSLDLDEVAIPQECGVQAHEQIHHAPLKAHIDRWGVPIYDRERNAR